MKIEEMTSGSAPNGVCATPVINIVGRKFVYECETPGAEFESILTTEERATGKEFMMKNKTIIYTLTVYATAEGYDRSMPATINFFFDSNDLNHDGIVGVADVVTILEKMASESRTQ